MWLYQRPNIKIMQKLINNKLVKYLFGFSVLAYLAEALYSLFIDGDRLSFVNDLQVSLLLLIYYQLLKMQVTKSDEEN